MRRREFITLIGGAAAWPLAASAQQPERMRRIGVLFAVGADIQQARLAAFVQALQQLGWTDGRNVRIDIRWAGSSVVEIRRHAAELAALAPDVILATGNVVEQVLQETRIVPVVFVIVPDPVGAGYVHTLSKPGGNATGFMQFEYSLTAKWPELLKEIAPGVMRAAVLRDLAIAAGIGQFAVIQYVAPSVGVEVSTVSVSDEAEIERGITAFARRPWPNRNSERVGSCSSRCNHLAGGPAQAARGVLPNILCWRRRFDRLWARFFRSVSPRGRLC
jgi:ABC-type uncharacterized transport system substrate-binding protein